MRVAPLVLILMSTLSPGAPAQGTAQHALIHSTYLGGEEGSDRALTGLEAVERDGAGNIIVAGSSKAVGIGTPGAPQQQPAGGSDALVAKYSPSGELLWATYLGSSEADYAQGVAVDLAGAIYITGWTFADYPTTPGAPNACDPEEQSSFVTKFAPTGELLWSACFPMDLAFDVEVSSAGTPLFTGIALESDLPEAHRHGPVGDKDAFVAEVAPDGSGLIRSALIGGTGSDGAQALALGGNGEVHVTGGTSSEDWPVTPGAPDDSLEGIGDAFLFKLSSDLGVLEYATYEGANKSQLGVTVDVDTNGQTCAAGSEERKHDRLWVLCVDPEGANRTFSFGRSADDGDLLVGALRFLPNGHLLLAGATDSKSLFLADELQNRYGGRGDGWISDLNFVGDEFFSTYVGGSGHDEVADLHVGVDGTITFVGATGSDDMPLVNPWQEQLRGAIDGHIGVIGSTDGGCRLVGTPGADRIWGSIANDRICGLGDDDLVWGRDGNDKLTGGSGDDHLYGQSGNDFANGGMGDDRCRAERKRSC